MFKPEASIQVHDALKGIREVIQEVSGLVLSCHVMSCHVYIDTVHTKTMQSSDTACEVVQCMDVEAKVH